VDLVSRTIDDLEIRMPRDSAELPDDGPIEWAPVAPYWSVLWRSGVALAREVVGVRLTGKRVVELGCGLALPSLAAARAGAIVTATDGCDEALALVEANARRNGLVVATQRLDWFEPGELGRFDLVLASDVLYERHSVAALLKLLPRLADEVWVADPGRSAADAFVEAAERDWSVRTSLRDGVRIHRLQGSSKRQ
jgi:predicted nicotinamide N-methyase